MRPVLVNPLHEKRSKELDEHLPSKNDRSENDMKTVSGFIAEVGDISRFTNTKQLQKLAGLTIVENSSGNHKGKSRISKRGRKRLRYLLFEAALSLTATNTEFKELHRYYTSRERNALKKIQSLIVLSNKLIRIFYTILKTGANYDPKKLLNDIRRPEGMSKAAYTGVSPKKAELTGSTHRTML